MSVKYTIPFRASDDVLWRVDIADQRSTDATVNWKVDEQTVPYFIDGNLQIINDTTGEIQVFNISESGTLKLPAGNAYRFFAFCSENPSGNPKIRLTVVKNSVSIFDNQIVANSTAQMTKPGIAQPMAVYEVTVKTVDTVVPVTPVNVDDLDPYANDTKTVKGVSEQAAQLAYDGETDEPFTAIYQSNLTINIYNEGQVDINELQKAQDRQFKVYLYRENVLKWIGYIKSDGIQKPLKAQPYSIAITVTDGLEYLENMPYVHANLLSVAGSAVRCPLNYIRQILNATENLGLALPIRWSNFLECTAFEGQDVMAGGVSWSVYDEGFYSYQSGQFGEQAGPIKSCRYILEGILKSMQCSLKQVDGRWTIRRVPDMISGFAALRYKEIVASLTVTTFSAGVDNLSKQIGSGGYGFIEEDHTMIVKTGIKTCKVTYNANVRENILPNGSQDLVATDGTFFPLYWGPAPTNIVNIVSSESLDGRQGISAKLINSNFVPGEYTTVNPINSEGLFTRALLPIDTKTLIRKISFGFIYSPVSGSVDLTIQIIFKLSSAVYYLNEFGFWVTDVITLPIVVESIGTGDVAKVDFDKFQGILMPSPVDPIAEGDISEIEVIFKVKAGQTFIVDNIYITTEQANDVYESTDESSLNTFVDERDLDISTSFGGYMLSNFMSRWNRSDEEAYFRDGLLHTGTLTSIMANAVMRFRYKSSDIFNGTVNTRKKDWSMDEIYFIETLDSAKFMPLNASYNIEKCEVFLVLMECRNDNAIFTEKYYSSNDQTLSN